MFDALEDLKKITSASSRDGARDDARRWLETHFTLARASVVLPLLPWPLDELIEDHGGVARTYVRVEGVLRAPGPRDLEVEAAAAQRERWRVQRYAWTCRVVRDGVFQRADDVLARALIQAEVILMGAPSAGSSGFVEGLLQHRSLHVRGYGWLGLLVLHERGVLGASDVVAHAHREPVEGMPLAAWVTLRVHPQAPLDDLLAPALADASPRTRREALLVIAMAPREPLLGLVTAVAALGREEPEGLHAWCRLAPDAWPELLAMSREQSPYTPSLALRRRADRQGKVLPTHRRTERAIRAIEALTAEAHRLPDDAVDAVTALAHDPSYDELLHALGPRARAALPVVAAREAARPRPELATLIAIGGEHAAPFVEPMVTRAPSIAARLAPLGEHAVPILRRALSQPLSASDRRQVVDGIARLASPSLANEAWALLLDPDEDVVNFAIAALLGMDVVRAPHEQHRMIDAFLRFQPSRSTFAPSFSRVASALMDVLGRWIEDAEDLLLVKLVRAAGSLGAWARPLLSTLRALRGGALREVVAAAIAGIESPPPMFEPNR